MKASLLVKQLMTIKVGLVTDLSKQTTSKYRMFYEMSTVSLRLFDYVRCFIMTVCWVVVRGGGKYRAKRVKCQTLTSDNGHSGHFIMILSK